MSLLVNNSSGILANTNGGGIVFYNPDPAFVERNLLTTIYTWAVVWGGASVQIYVAPQPKLSPFAPVWFPLNDPFIFNSFYTFRHRWSQIKAEVTGATSTTSGLFCELFSPR